MFKIESYITPILLSYVDKYVRDFKPANAQVSLWGGGVVLHNLVLKEDVLQREVRLPFTLVSGRIHELLINVPWTKIMSEPIVVTIDTIECVLNLKPPESEDSQAQAPPSRKTQVVEAPPGYMQALVRRIVSNIAVKVQHLIVKYVQDDIVMSLNVKHLSIDSAGTDWEKSFADIDQNMPMIRRLVRFDDFTLCLDKADADGKIRFYQEPLLYRCQLDLRVLTRLVSANARRASAISIQLRSSKLAWSVTSDQLVLLLRLLNERQLSTIPKQTSVPKQSSVPAPSQTSSLKSHVAEPTRSASWSEWAWSWLPSWTDKEGGADDMPVTPVPLPLYFSAFIDDVSLVFKIMELEVGTNRKRFRNVLDFGARHAALKSGMCFPTAMRARFGARDIELRSFGKCVCGFVNYDGLKDRPTIFLKRTEEISEDWQWPEDHITPDQGHAASKSSVPVKDEDVSSKTTNESTLSNLDNQGTSTTNQPTAPTTEPSNTASEGIPEGLPSKDNQQFPDMDQPHELLDESDDLWTKMNPVLYIELKHDRTPPRPFQNPYDNPPTDFEYSDWVEEVHTKFKLKPIEVRVCMGLIHRVTTVVNMIKEVYSIPKPEPQMRVLTVEECDALNENLPERRLSVEVLGLRVCLVPWNHTERAVLAPLVLGVELPNTTVTLIGPLYPQRVCAAACQLPGTTSPLWQLSRLNVSVTVNQAQLFISSYDKLQQKPCARGDIRLVMHVLLNKEYFTKVESVEISYLLKISNVNVCGSAARLQAACQVPQSVIEQQVSVALSYSSLPKDALNDEDNVAIDFELEEVIVRGFHTRNVNTVICTIQSAKATAFHEPKPGEVKQAWLFSAPDAPVASPYLRLAVQWCNEVTPKSFDYLGLWTEPTAISIDPLLISWLAYKPVIVAKPVDLSTNPSVGSRSFGSTQYLQRIRGITSTASRSSWSASDAERVHVRQRSSPASSTEPSEKKNNPKPKVSSEWWRGEKLVVLHKRLRNVLMNVEIGLTLVYVTMSTVSAVDCATLRDAMERHAIQAHRVLALSLGRMSMTTNSANKFLWQELKHDGPTFLTDDVKPTTESFPWKIRLADVSCYTMEPHEERVAGGSTINLRSNIKKQPALASPRTVLELVTTTVTITVVTKTIQVKNYVGTPPFRRHADTGQKTPVNPDEAKTKYFKTGKDFKPATLKEFFRGPRHVKKEKVDHEKPQPATETAKPQEIAEMVSSGPLVSLGVNLHADTPPVIIKLERDQIHVIAAAIHCMNHIVTLLKRQPLTLPKRSSSNHSFFSAKTCIRSVSEIEEPQSPSEGSKGSEIVDILKPDASLQKPVKTFFWFQWVVSHARLVVASRTVKLALDIDDIISTVDIQTVYQQFKIKIATATIKHYERAGSKEWIPGVLGGRVLEARETIGTREEDHFLAATITHAHFSNLPQSWKQELHPKLLELKEGDDAMWEVYIILAPLEVVIQPVILDNIGTLIKEMKPRDLCPLKVEYDSSMSSWQWPFCYVTAGGLRVLVTSGQQSVELDDTFMFHIGSITMNPHPDNPVCRRMLNAPGETWPATASNLEGRQYEINVMKFAVRSAQFVQLVSQETMTTDDNTNINPAFKWSQEAITPAITTILQPVDICCVLAPPVCTEGVLTAGLAIDFNLITDCIIDINVAQLVMWHSVMTDIHSGFLNKEDVFMAPRAVKHSVCPYADLIGMPEPEKMYGGVAIIESAVETAASVTGDSGVETLASMPTTKSRVSEDIQVKKTVSYAYYDQMTLDSSEFVELFLTMGNVEWSLYVDDDNSPERSALRPPRSVVFDQPMTPAGQATPPITNTSPQMSQKLKKEDSAKSITPAYREADVVHSKLNLMGMQEDGKKQAEKVPLLHVTLTQPNLYYWRNRGQKNIQVSLFDAEVGLGTAPSLGGWHLDLLTTARGAADHVTGIPPALATLNIVAPVAGYLSGTNTRGSIKLDVERPIQLTVNEERITRLKGIYNLLHTHLFVNDESEEGLHQSAPLLYSLRQRFLQESIESVVVNTSQVAVCGQDGVFGWDGCACQLAAGARTERLTARALLTALVVTVGPPTDGRHILLQPMMMGAQLEATWEAWRRAEGGPSAREPAVRIGLELDHISLDLRPTDIITFNKLHNTLQDIMQEPLTKKPVFISNRQSLSQIRFNPSSTNQLLHSDSVLYLRRPNLISDSDSNSHYYKDDLRSGAFKILQGGQLPMAYQVILHGHSVSWRYPHPRAITRIVAFPLPGADTEMDCVLEVYTPMLDKWESHTYFKIPVGEPRELLLNVSSPEAVFGTMWRFRACQLPEKAKPAYNFNVDKFKPRADPLLIDRGMDRHDSDEQVRANTIAEQLSGILRVDSYFAPKLLPRIHLLVQMGNTEIHLHNSLPLQSSTETSLEGYYVSRPLMRTHRMLSVITNNTKVHVHFGTPAGVMAVVDTTVCADIIECATGTMQQLVKNFRLQMGMSCSSWNGQNARLRGTTSIIQVALHVPRLRTLQALGLDWCASYETCYKVESRSSVMQMSRLRCNDTSADTAVALEGRVSLWVHNNTTSALRIGQEGTDEVVPLGPGARLAYRWHNPVSPKKLRIALADPSADWQWSTSVPFTPTSVRVKLENSTLEKQQNTRGLNVYVFVRVVESGAKRTMTLSGRVALANMLRFNFLFKVRSRCLETGQWRTVCSDELQPESVGRSVICTMDTDLVLKIKRMSQETGWSGDIPLRECPKENVPWLVKVPLSGDMSYVSVWCRVVRARNDGRILATVWPLYVLHSHLPLDTDVLIVTERSEKKDDQSPEQAKPSEPVRRSSLKGETEVRTTDTHPPPLIQSTPGRGCSTHLLAPGTTANRHNLSFQYRNIDSMVTREAVPMHYGVTDVSVFDKRTPVMNIEEVEENIHDWLKRSGHHAKSNWPYSIVANHWVGVWKSALLQPRCDVTVRYRAVHAGGGCSLEIQLCPTVLLCNAVPIWFTLRAHDAAPLCKLEAGAAISPPCTILTKPFFLSVEVGRETFVSEQLQVSNEEPGRYGSLPPRHLAIDHSAHFTILCNQKVALLTMFYEIKEEINVFGITSTYVLINRLGSDLLISAIAVPTDSCDELDLKPKHFKIVNPTPDGSIHGTSLSRFWLRGRWRGGEPNELNTFVSLALPTTSYCTERAVPVRLGKPPLRRAIALIDKEVSVPIIVTQIKHENRWLVIVSHDPCPQFVVSNYTSLKFYIGQPVHMPQDQPTTSIAKVLPECQGAQWCSMVPPGSTLHYSTPSYCMRYPPLTPPAAPASNSSVVMLTFGRKVEERIEEWCPAVAVTDGEQLLQYYGGVTIKLRVHTYPHSTLLELRDTDQNDISASDIRRRLDGAVSLESILNLGREQHVERADDTNKSVKVDVSSARSLERVSETLDMPNSNWSPNMSDDAIASKLNAPSTSGTKDDVRRGGNHTGLVSVTNMLFDEDGVHKRYESSSQYKQYKLSNDIFTSDSSLHNAPLDLEVAHSQLHEVEHVRFVMSGVVVEMAATADVPPLFALHLDRTALLLQADAKKTRTTISIADLQIDNMQYESGQYDFAVVASTRAIPLDPDPWPALWNMFGEHDAFATKQDDARLTLKVTHDKWHILSHNYRELTEVELQIGTLALYVEDAYVTALVELSRVAWPATVTTEVASVLAEERSIQNPLRLRRIYLHPLDLTLTLHTAVRMYIALDQSPLRLSAFKLHDIITSPDRLTHALTVHYLSAAILGAGWVVGGLELLGAPGALAARLGGASGGVRGVASATAAALLRSLSAWAGSLARNLDILAGDEDHARRAAAARRRLPPSFVAGLLAGVTNFAINILGAVGGLAHHPLVGVAVGETDSSVAALRRGILGALTKPLSATADLVAYAGHGLLKQTGWDPVPLPRNKWLSSKTLEVSAWRRDCVRWTFRLADLNVLAGFEVLLADVPAQLLITEKYLVVADPESEKIVEMIDFRFCTVSPYLGQVIELRVAHRRPTKTLEGRNPEEEDQLQINAQAMARVARYTGAEGAPSSAEVRVLALLPPLGLAHGLHAALTALAHQNDDAYLSFL